jgi:hypothetical protein
LERFSLRRHLVFFGHWFDYFYMIKPGVFINAQEAMAHGQEAGGHALNMQLRL